MAAFRQAIAIRPDYAEAHSNLGNVLKDKGHLDEALAAFRQATAFNPNFPEAHYNLGNVLKDKGQLDEAIAAFRQAIAVRPNYPEAHSNLGNALKDKGQLDEAIAAYCQAIRLEPGFAQAHNNLGTALNGVGKLDEAVAAYRQAIRLKPDLAEAHNNLGSALNAKGQLDEAVAAYRQAIRLKPDSADTHRNLGTTLYSKGRFNEAIAAHRQAIRLKPDYAEAYNGLGHALHKAGQVEAASAAFREAIRLRPDKPEWQFELAALLGDRSFATTPVQYVRELFDKYAATFDKDLVEKLKYQAPQQLLRAVRQATERRDLDVLDLGCGTGLCGQEFRPYARRLVGVDLSPEMIRAAEARGIYDQLITGEILAVLRKVSRKYDLIVAGDVLVYIGDLTDLIPAVELALRRGGLFAFSIEDYDRQGFFLQPQERFAHSIGYIRDLAAASGLTEISAERAVTRFNAGAEVRGRIVVLGKSA
jgi:predicted TPR repeat methyltransferase